MTLLTVHIILIFYRKTNYNLVHKNLLLDSSFYPDEFSIKRMSLFVFHGTDRLVNQVTVKEKSRGHVVHIGEKANGYGVLVEKPLGRYR